MQTIERILVPVAFSDNCRGTARHAAALACRFNSQVTLLHVMEPLGDALEFAEGRDQMQSARREWYMRELERFFHEQLRGVRAQKLLLEGDPAKRIVGFAEKEHIDLIAMASRGHGQFRRLLLGSVTAKVLHDSHCPVWTGVHMEMGLIPEDISFGTIACAVDLRDHADSVAGWGAGLAEAFGSKLHVVHCVPEGTSDDVRERSLSLLRALVDGAEIHIELGDSPRGICRAVEKINPDVLVIGRGHGAGGSGRLPSTTYGILRSSPCPCVSV